MLISFAACHPFPTFTTPTISFGLGRTLPELTLHCQLRKSR